MPEPIEQLDRLEEALAAGCACHLSAPCALCVLLTEEQAQIYWSDGAAALRASIPAMRARIIDGEPEAAPASPRPSSPPPPPPAPEPPVERPQPDPHRVAVYAIYDRFGRMRPEEALGRRRYVATDPQTGTTIRSSWWDVRVDDGDAAAECSALVLEFAERELLIARLRPAPTETRGGERRRSRLDPVTGEVIRSGWWSVHRDDGDSEADLERAVETWALRVRRAAAGARP